jgi:hypothetical protein
MADSFSQIAALRKMVAELTEQVRRLEAVVGRQNQRIDELQTENRQLQDQWDQAQRQAARQAAPFRRREQRKKRDGDKKSPGRKPGHQGHCRRMPEQVDDEIDVPLDRCPRCGGDLEEVRLVEQVIEEIPPMRPRVVRLRTYRGRCAGCGEVWSTHPLQSSHGQGAAKVQLGPRALSIAALLNKHLGLTMRKTCGVLERLFGLRLTAGGLSQALDRIAGKLVGPYAALRAAIRHGPAVHADETSWWVGGPGWWLWTFTTPNETLYEVNESRGGKVVREVLGDHYGGMLVSDCLSSYDPIDCRKHKCIAHHLRAIAKARDRPGQDDSTYLDAWERLLKTVIVLHRLAVDGTLDASQLAAKRTALQAWADRLLAKACTQTGDAAIQKRLGKQRAHLFGCLWDLAAEPTNNRAERSLRPAVIARKLSCGNKTDRGRRTWQVLTSLAETCRQRGEDVLDFLAARIPLTSPAG